MLGGNTRRQGFVFGFVFLLMSAFVIAPASAQAFSTFSCHETGSCEGDEGDFEGGDGGQDMPDGDNSVTITVQDEDGTPLSGQEVAAFCGMGGGDGAETTNGSGQATITGLTNGNCGAEVGTSAGYYADMVFFTFPSSTSAQTKSVTITASPLDLTYTTTLKDSDGVVVEGVTMYMVDTTGHRFSGPTPSNGQLQWNLHADTYRLTAINEDGTEYLPETEFTVSTTGGTGTYQMEELNSIISGTVTAADGGAALASARLVIFSDNGMRMATAGSDGTFSFRLVPGTYSIKAEKSGYKNGNLKNIVLSAGETKSSQNLALETASNTLNLTTVDEDGTTITDVGAVTCNDAGATADPNNIYFGRSSTGTFTYLLPDGMFTCRAFADGYVVASAPEVTLADAETEAAQLVLIPVNATLNVSLVNQNGEAVSGVRFGMYGVSTEGYTFNAFSPSGETTVGVVGSTYKVQAYVMGTGYATDFEQTTEVTVAENGSANVQLTVYEKDATVSGTILDADGAAVADAIVRATRTASDGTVLEFSALTNSAGTYTMEVVSGEYTVTAAAEDAEDLPSGVTAKTVAADATVDTDLALQNSNATLVVTPTGVDAGDIEEGSCYAFSAEDDIYATAEISDGAASVAITDGSWKYGCRLTANSTKYTTVTEGEITMVDGQTDSVSIAVTEVGTFFDPFAIQFNASAGTSFTLPDGTEIQIPANTFDVSGSVNVTVKQLDAAVAEDDQFPIQPIELSATDSTGRVIREKFQGNVSIIFHYDEDVLGALGIDADTLTGDNFNEGAWVTTDQGYARNSGSGTVTLTTNHFSTFGLMGQKGTAEIKSAVPGKARALKAKKIKSTSALLTWKQPKNSDVTKYVVQLRKFKVKKKKQWTTYKNVTKKQKKVSGLKAATKYEFRVKACDGDVCGTYTKWTKFKTKKK